MSLEPLLQFFQTLVQSQPGDQTGKQKILRTLSMNASPTIQKAEQVQDLSQGDLRVVTEFTGPWQNTVVAISFVDGAGAPDRSPKDFGFYLILGGDEYPLLEMQDWDGTGAALTDTIKLAPGDQLCVKAAGTCTARVQIRGEAL